MFFRCALTASATSFKALLFFVMSVYTFNKRSCMSQCFNVVLVSINTATQVGLKSTILSAGGRCLSH